MLIILFGSVTIIENDKNFNFEIIIYECINLYVREFKVFGQQIYGWNNQFKHSKLYSNGHKIQLIIWELILKFKYNFENLVFYKKKCI